MADLISAHFVPVTSGAVRRTHSLGERVSALRLGSVGVFDGDARDEPSLLEMFANGTIVEHSISRLRPTRAWSIADGLHARHGWTIVSPNPGRLLVSQRVDGTDADDRYRLFDVDRRAVIADLGVVPNAGALRGHSIAVAVDSSGFIVRTAVDEAALYSRDGALIERSSRLMECVRAGAFGGVNRLWSIDRGAALVEHDRVTGAKRTLALPEGAKTVYIRALQRSGLALVELYAHPRAPSRALCVDPERWCVLWEQPSYFFMAVELANDERHVVLVPTPDHATVHDVQTGALLATGAKQSHWRIKGAHNGELLCNSGVPSRQAVRAGALVESMTVERTPIRAVWIAPDGARLVVNHEDGVTLCYDLASSRLVGETRAHRILGEAPGGRAVVLAHDDGAESAAFEWNGADDSQRFALSPARCNAHSLAISQDGRYVVAQGEGTIGVVVLSRDEREPRARVIPTVTPYGIVVFDEEAQRVWLHKNHERWEVSLAEAAPTVTRTDAARSTPDEIVSMAANRALIVYELVDESIEIFDLRSESSRVMKLPTSARRALTEAAPRALPVVARDAARFAIVSCDDTRVSLHDARGGVLGVIEFALGEDSVRCCAFSSDGSRFVLASRSGVTHVFELNETQSAIE